MRNSLICLTLISFCLASAAQAEGLKLCGTLRQGEILRASAGAEMQAVTINGKPVPLAENGDFCWFWGVMRRIKLK